MSIRDLVNDLIIMIMMMIIAKTTTIIMIIMMKTTTITIIMSGNYRAPFHVKHAHCLNRFKCTNPKHMHIRHSRQQVSKQ